MSTTNRLRLDFSLVTTDERNAFLTDYLRQEQFANRPPTDEELETMSNYLLWGKDPVTGLNAKQTKTVDMTTKHGTWDRQEAESLELLLESPTFNEIALINHCSAPTKVTKENFSRQEALEQCPDYLRQPFLDLFHQIDELDLAINFYDLAHGRRTKPPRDHLLAKFTPEQQDKLRESVRHWPQYKYLKQRHQLVELRRQQYIFRDSYRTVIAPAGPQSIVVPGETAIDINVEVLPLGTSNNTYAAALLFNPWSELVPTNYTDDQLQVISACLWQKKEYTPLPTQKYIDFRLPEHVCTMFDQFYELEDAAAASAEGRGDNNLSFLMKTLQFYIDQAELTDLQREILELKLQKVKNVDIAAAMNKKWHKTYTPNYISTIFRQRIIPRINEAAAYHEKLVSNIFFPEEFKTCTKCGHTFLRDPNNFTRKSRSKDGFTTRCKACEKAARTKTNK